MPPSTSWSVPAPHPSAVVQVVATVALSAYLVYMFRHFRTTFTVHHPLEAVSQAQLGDYFRHPMGNTRYGSKICPFGKHAILALVAALWLRLGLRLSGRVPPTTSRTLARVTIVVTGLCALLNMNAVLYLVPYFAYEAWVGELGG